MMLATPELVETQLIEVLDQLEVAPELEHRVLPGRVVWSEEAAELDWCRRWRRRGHRQRLGMHDRQGRAGRRSRYPDLTRNTGGRSSVG
jgi:cob(I)alamin adenosyltransferase